LKILAGVLVHRATRPLRGSVSCGSGWSVPCVSIQLTLSQNLRSYLRAPLMRLRMQTRDWSTGQLRVVYVSVFRAGLFAKLEAVPAAEGDPRGKKPRARRMSPAHRCRRPRGVAGRSERWIIGMEVRVKGGHGHYAERQCWTDCNEPNRPSAHSDTKYERSYHGLRMCT
jgi:hypothetical protein